ncbi:hypothetical protein BHYA_0037g00230 [Botrytis hyacinthi]|uniref:Uncharacterized protein n=1 Tax=Botrytis hyacinthi TaxID=278943 RepID=A0A4Z1GU29_9HELO|nr:hypothetical protein BHYA_0037g00230 [Botrytis hyacinthi]
MQGAYVPTSDPAPVDMTQPRGLDAVFDRITPLKLKDYLFFHENSLATRNEDEENLKALRRHGRQGMFHYFFSSTADTGAPGHAKDEFTTEASLLAVAGTNTAAITKTGFYFSMLRPPRVYGSLVQEIRSDIMHESR